MYKFNEPNVNDLLINIEKISDEKCEQKNDDSQELLLNEKGFGYINMGSLYEKLKLSGNDIN